MTIARSERVDEETTPYYHCMSRCVRRAFLCGDDPYTGKNFDHRRVWLIERLTALADVFSIDVLAYAVMANHWHVVLSLRSDRVSDWSTEEVVARFGSVFPHSLSRYQKLSEQGKADVEQVWRARLSDVSWMMKAMNEWVARKANREDGCTEHFWQGRFRCEPLLDVSALITCMAYVDLNPIRAGECQRLEDAKSTSIGQRLAALERVMEQVADSSLDPRDPTAIAVVPAGLLAFADQCESDPACSSTLDSVPMNLVDYVELLEWSGRCKRERGPSGQLQGPPSAILQKLQLHPEGWRQAMEQGLPMRGALGRLAPLAAHRTKQAHKRLTGRTLANQLFTPE